MTGAVTHDFASLADGIHTVYLKAFDLVDNTATTSVTFRVDTIDPTITITAPAPGFYSDSFDVRVDWEGSDSGSGILGYQYRIDGQGWSSISDALTYIFTTVVNGNHTVDVRAIDLAGNDFETSVTFNVDTVPPILTITGPMEGLNTNSTTVSVFWSGSDATSGIKGYQYKIDTGSYSALSLGLTHDFAGLTDGPHTVYIKAFDNADNSETAVFHCIVDTVVPTLAISHPTEGWFTGSTAVTAFWNGSDATSGIMGYAYSLDGASWTGTGMGLSHTFTGLGEGSHTVTVLVTDYALNYNIVSVTFTVDLTAPAITISSPADDAITNVSSMTVTWSATDGASGVLDYQYSIDGLAWSVRAGSLSHEFAGLTDGVHLVGIRSYDNVGNAAYAWLNFTVDVTAPSVSITVPNANAITNADSMPTEWTGDDLTTGLQGFRFRIDAGEWSSVSMTWTNTFTELSDGLHTVTVEAYDVAHNHASASVTFRVDTIDPTVTITAPAPGFYSDSFDVRVDWEGSDSGSGILGYQYRIDGQSWSATSGVLTYIFTTGVNGNHTVDVHAIDLAGNDFETSVTFNVDTVPPTVTITVPNEGLITNSTTVSVFWAGSDATSGIKGYQYKIDTGAWSVLSLDLTHEFAGLTDGSHTVSIRAYDNANNSEIALFHCTVDTSRTGSGHQPPDGRLVHRQHVRHRLLERVRRHLRHPGIRLLPGRCRLDFERHGHQPRLLRIERRQSHGIGHGDRPGDELPRSSV